MLKQTLRRFAAREWHGRIEAHYGLTSKCVFKSLSTPDPLFERRMKGFLWFGTEFADDFLGDATRFGQIVRRERNGANYRMTASTVSFTKSGQVVCARVTAPWVGSDGDFGPKA